MGLGEGAPVDCCVWVELVAEGGGFAGDLPITPAVDAAGLTAEGLVDLRAVFAGQGRGFAGEEGGAPSVQPALPQRGQGVRHFVDEGDGEPDGGRGLVG